MVNVIKDTYWERYRQQVDVGEDVGDYYRQHVGWRVGRLAQPSRVRVYLPEVVEGLARTQNSEFDAQVCDRQNAIAQPYASL